MGLIVVCWIVNVSLVGFPNWIFTRPAMSESCFPWAESFAPTTASSDCNFKICWNWFVMTDCCSSRLASRPGFCLAPLPNPPGVCQLRPGGLPVDRVFPTWLPEHCLRVPDLALGLGQIRLLLVNFGLEDDQLAAHVRRGLLNGIHLLAEDVQFRG